MRTGKIYWALFWVFIALAVVFICNSCQEDQQQDDTQQTVSIDKHGAVDVKVHQTVVDGKTVIAMEKIYYDDNGSIVKESTSIDTLPLLKVVADTLDTGRTYEDSDGDTQEVDTVLVHPKLYQFFVTIK